VAVRSSSQEIAWSAIGGRLAFVATLLLLLYAAFFPFPRLFASTHVAHFAGFYIFSFACAAAAKRMPLLVLGCYVAAVAILIEALRALIWLPLASSYLDWVGDMAGVVGALAPMLLQKIRAQFAGRPPLQR
jgi:hypothetical protein